MVKGDSQIDNTLVMCSATLCRERLWEQTKAL